MCCNWLLYSFFYSRLHSMIIYSYITKEENWFVATAMPTGVVSQGKTIEEAKANLQEALELYYS